jgi:hypothetical protein
MEEEYRVCFENYEISNLGNCRKKLLNGEYRLIKGSINNRGYYYFQLQREGKRINKLFHHLVAECFLGERPEGLVIDHIDRNKINNNISNLRYISFQENLKNCERYRSDIETQDKKERNKIFCAEYKLKNPNQKKEYYEKNKEVIKNKVLEYKKQNEEKLKKYRTQKWTCEKCNKTMLLGSKSGHLHNKEHNL